MMLKKPQTKIISPANLKFCPNTHKISFQNMYQIHKITEEIMGISGICHFTLFVAQPTGSILSISKKPAIFYQIAARGYSPAMANVVMKICAKQEFSLWHSALSISNSLATSTQSIVEHFYGQIKGFFLNRILDEFLLVYSIGIQQNKFFDFEFIVNNLNSYLSVGDALYNEFRTLLMPYSDIDPPMIDKFYPYVGGPPEKHYTKDYLKKQSL